MSEVADDPRSSRPRMFALGRVRATLIACVIASLLMLPSWEASYALLIGRWMFVGGVALIAFGTFERWPRRLPERLARWVLQVVAVAVSIPLSVFAIYVLTTQGDPAPFWHSNTRLGGFASMSVLGLLVAPWMAVSALVRQINGEARNQALAFELERSELERRATDARLRLLQAQVEPHFLFNTLANVRELVDSGSPRASSVLDSLIAYLRAAVPRLADSATTMGQEIELVRAYLAVMHMRMPDRLAFTFDVDDAALPFACPPMTLLTLIENSVRHGIDPSEDGGRIEVRVELRGERVVASVVDTGQGLRDGQAGLGTGLSTLRERLSLAFGGDASLRVAPVVPRGVAAEIDIPARRADR